MTECFKGALYVSIEGSGAGGGLFIYNEIGDTPQQEYCTADFGHTSQSTYQLCRETTYAKVSIKNNSNNAVTFRINEALCV